MATTVYEQLLEVQQHDTRLDQLAHRRDGLPERERIVEADQVLATVEGQIAAQTEAVAEARRAQRRIEDELATHEARAGQLDAKLYDGSVSAIRELQDLQTELETVRGHISTVEDADLEALERLEAAQSRQVELESMRAEVLARRGEAEVSLTAAAAEIDAEADEVTAARTVAATGIPAELLDEYERLRRSLGGVAVARLNRHRCEGCHLELSAVEVDRIGKLDPAEMVHCEECGRLLVR